MAKRTAIVLDQTGDVLSSVMVDVKGTENIHYLGSPCRFIKPGLYIMMTPTQKKEAKIADKAESKKPWWKVW